MRLADLHVHTTYSDGYDTPSAVVKMAAANNVAVMAVTDHDNLGGIREAVAAGAKMGVKVIAGVEISTRFHDRTVHMLGYGLPLDHVEFNKFLNKLYRYRKTAMVTALAKLNAEFAAADRPLIDLDDFIKAQGEYFNNEKTARYLVVKGFYRDQEETVQLMFSLTRGSAAHPAGFPAATAEAIAAIHQAGGVAILAHPFASGTSLRKIDPTPAGQEKLLKEMVAFGLDGLECYQSEHGPEETSFALSLAAKYDLLASAGSDWHGAVCDVANGIAERKGFYPECIGGLGVTTEQIAPLLARLGLPRT